MAYFGMADLSSTAMSLAVPVIVVGLGHKLDKVAKAMHTVAAILNTSAQSLDAELQKVPAEAPAPSSAAAVQMQQAGIGAKKPDGPSA